MSQKRSWTDWEGAEQRALFQWASAKKLSYQEEDEAGQLRLLSIADVMFWIPNGVARLSPAVAGKMRAQGLTSGVPDLCLPIAKAGYHGLYIELKAQKPHTAPITEHQRRWILRLQRFGYAAAVAQGWVAASELITAYLKGEWQR
jgi:hypothetical protein